MLLKGKIAVITGASAGIGQATARLFASHGATLVLTGRRLDRLQALAAELAPAKMHIAAFDISNKEAAQAALGHLPKGFSQVDILVNNAGLARGLVPFHQLDMADIEQMINTNIKGLCYATHLLLPGMVQRGAGHVVNLSSIAGSYPYPGSHVYGATKSFATQLSLNLKSDLLGTPIKITSIEPGMVDTEFSTVRLGDKTQADEVYAGLAPLIAEDIAQSILWCVTRPPHVNINRMEIMPVQQAFSPLAVSRDES